MDGFHLLNSGLGTVQGRLIPVQSIVNTDSISLMQMDSMLCRCDGECQCQHTRTAVVADDNVGLGYSSSVLPHSSTLDCYTATCLNKDLESQYLLCFEEGRNTSVFHLHICLKFYTLYAC